MKPPPLSLNEPPTSLSGGDENGSTDGFASRRAHNFSGGGGVGWRSSLQSQSAPASRPRAMLTSPLDFCDLVNSSRTSSTNGSNNNKMPNHRPQASEIAARAGRCILERPSRRHSGGVLCRGAGDRSSTKAKCAAAGEPTNALNPHISSLDLRPPVLDPTEMTITVPAYGCDSKGDGIAATTPLLPSVSSVTLNNAPSASLAFGRGNTSGNVALASSRDSKSNRKKTRSLRSSPGSSKGEKDGLPTHETCLQDL